MAHPETTDWMEVHVRYSQGDKAAWDEIAEYFLPRLTQRLCNRRSDVDPHLLAESVEDALLDYRKSPQRFDTTYGVPLGYWLWLKTRGYLSHRLRRQQRHKAKEQAVGVTDKIFEKYLSKMSREMAIYIGMGEDENRCRQTLDRVLPRLSLRDRKGVELLSHGASFETWLKYVGNTYLPADEQRRKINAEKSRLRKKLRRLVQSSGTVPLR
jgi:hypothetical protein